MPLAEAVGIVGLGYLDRRADDRMVGSNRREAMGQLVLGLGEKPDDRGGRQRGGHGSEVRVRLIVQAGHEDCSLGRYPRAVERRPEQVGREHDRGVLRGVAGEVQVQVRDTKTSVAPGELVGTRPAARPTGASPAPCSNDDGPGSGRLGTVESVTDPSARHARRELVRPSEMVLSTGRQNFDLVTTLGQAVRGLAHDRLRAAYDSVSVARRDKGDASLACAGYSHFKR